MIELVIFDVDGTLAEAYTLNLLPGVKDFFHLVFTADCPTHLKMAIATNQGGVGMRYWMEKGRFGEPDEYPTRQEIEERMRQIVGALGGDPSLPVYVSYRFQTKKGNWAPVPSGEEENPEWSMEWRKPGPGMLLQAMQDAGAAPENTMFVGDSADDLGAARAAGCAFRWARDFFSQEWQRCDQLEDLKVTG